MIKYEIKHKIVKTSGANWGMGGVAPQDSPNFFIGFIDSIYVHALNLNFDSIYVQHIKL